MKLVYENIRVRLGGREILKGLTLSAEKGKITGITGPNGCGKSTLVRTTLGIQPVESGRILLEGRDVLKIPPAELAGEIGYVAQDIPCAFDFSVEEVISMGIWAGRKRKTGQKTEGAVEAALKELGILHLKDRSILSLSGGERKLVFLARAAAQGPDLWILDEPTNHLDIRHQLFLMEYLKRSGRTVLAVLHDLRLAAHYCDRLYVLHEGNVAACGTPEEALSEEHVRRVFGICGEAVRRGESGLDFSLFPESGKKTGSSS